MGDNQITIVIPAKDEAANIARIIQGCRRHAASILVVDGCSRDQTRAVSEQQGARVIQDNGKGKGDGIRCAIPHIDTPITVFIDADGSHNPDDIPALIQPILDDAADHVSGSRLIGGSSELHGGLDEFLRLTGSAFITLCINWRFKVRLSESQNGFRAIKTSVLQQLGLRENITTIEQEMIIKTLKKGFRMAEVPTHEYPRVSGKSSIVVAKVWFRYVLSFFKYLFF